MELQAVGPRGSETLQLEGLKNGRERIQVPIPPDIDSEGGIFQIDLVSVEDTYGCKKDLAVPGISVNVRRVKVSLYGQFSQLAPHLKYYISADSSLLFKRQESQYDHFGG